MKTYGYDLRKMTAEELNKVLDDTRAIIRTKGTFITVAERGLCEAILRELESRK